MLVGASLSGACTFKASSFGRREMCLPSMFSFKARNHQSRLFYSTRECIEIVTSALCKEFSDLSSDLTANAGRSLTIKVLQVPHGTADCSSTDSPPETLLIRDVQDLQQPRTAYITWPGSPAELSKTLLCVLPSRYRPPHYYEIHSNHATRS